MVCKVAHMSKYSLDTFRCAKKTKSQKLYGWRHLDYRSPKPAMQQQSAKENLHCLCAFPIVYLFMVHECFHLEDSFVLVHHGQKWLSWWCQGTLLTPTRCPVQNGANIHKGPWALSPGKAPLPFSWSYISGSDMWNSLPILLCSNEVQKLSLLWMLLPKTGACIIFWSIDSHLL